MAEAVIVAGARTPIGKLSGALAGFTGHGPRGFRHRGGVVSVPGCRPTRSTTCYGPGHPRRPGPDHGPPGGGEGRYPHVRPGQHHQQGLPLRPQHDLPGRPDDPRRRCRHRGGRRHGVDDPGPLPAARGPRRLPHRRRRPDRLHDVRRPHRRLRPHRDGPVHRAAQREDRASRVERQDAFAAASHEKAAAAIKDGRLAEEIVPVQVPQRKGDPLLVDTDEGVRPGTTAESLGSAEAGVHQGRHHHGRQRVADLRRGRRRRRDVGGQGQGARPAAARAGRRATAWWPVRTTRS